MASGRDASDTEDSDHTVLTLPRGERGEVRLCRSRYEGRTFTKLHLWYPGSDGQLHPGRQVVTIRDHELEEVIAALSRIRARAGAELPATQAQQPPTPRSAHAPRTGDLTTEDRSADMEAF